MFVRQMAAAVMGLTLVAPAAGFAAPNRKPMNINARERHQTMRITQGVRTDEITRGEFNRLKADEAAIRAEERVYRKSGEGLSRWERVDLERDLNRASREIYRAKHNDRARPARASK